MAKWQSQATAASVVANTKCLKYLCALTYAAFFLLSFPFCCCCRCSSCNSFGLVFAAHTNSTRALAFRRQPALCHVSRPAPSLCSLSWACPNDRVAWHGMAWRALAWRRAALRRQTPLLSLFRSLSLSLSTATRKWHKPSLEPSDAKPNRTQRKRGESRHSRLRPTERNSHSVNAHALRQLTVSVNHGDERITGNTRAAAALNQQPLNQKEIKYNKIQKKKQKTNKQ